MGVDGFREDVITFISKKDGLPDDYIMPASKGFLYFNHGPHLHEYLEEFKRDVFSKYDCMILAEAPMVTPKKALEYIDENKNPVLDMMIQFSTQEADCLFTDFNHIPFNLRKLKRAFSNWQTKLDGKGWNMLYLENHDHPRMVSRYGSEKFRDESAKALAVSYLFQKGTPFVYQGQEIGMSNWYPSDPEMYEDVQTRWQYFNVGTKKSPEKRLQRLWHGSRDSARTPVQWSAEENAGFTTGKPWIPVNPNHAFINAESEVKDLHSVFHHYRKLISLRKTYDVFRSGTFALLCPEDERIFAYTRDTDKEHMLVVCNFTGQTLDFDAPERFRGAEMLLNNYEEESPRLRPYEAVILYYQG